jgi:lipoprotein-anchoring transpeptidase ErfK/SrfK
MRKLVMAAVSVAVLLGAVAGVQAYVGLHRSDTDAVRVAALRAEWNRDAAQGVPDALLAPLRARLAARVEAPWWSLTWWTTAPQTQLDRLQADTHTAWVTAVAAARDRASQVVDDAGTFLTQAGSMAPSGMAGAVAGWNGALEAASTPADIDALVHIDAGVLATARRDVAEARAAAAAVAAALQSAGGPDGLLGQATALDAKANAANLDASAMDALAAQLHALLAAAQPASAVEAQLGAAIQAFRQTLALNDSIDGGMRPLMYDVDQAVVEATPTASAFQKTYATAVSSFAAARNQAQLITVQQSQQQLQAQVSAELAADNCGHNVGAGKDLVVSLSMQEMVAYQDGCAVRATPVTTGRPQLPTPAGSYHVFFKTTPWMMRSPWPPGSPFWYPNTLVTWVLEFREGGYFLHDADWEPTGDYGPGGEFNQSAASHGCIHIPTPFMQWLYGWTPVGTPVQVVA